MNMTIQKLFMVTHLLDKGFITLVTVLVVGAIGLSIASSLILLGVGATKTGISIQQSNGAKALALTCAEEALEKIREESGFSGSGNISLGQGTCSYTVSLGSGEARTVTATGTVSTVVRKVEIGLSQINPTITITSWQEVDDF